MCGRYEIEISEAAMREIIAEVERKFPGEQLHTGEIFPTNTAPLLVREAGGLAPLPALWGFPQYGGRKGVLINARAETVEEKVSWRNSFLEGRCVVPSTGFYEWTQQKPKQKYQFRLAEPGLLYMAGLWKQIGAARHFVIVTTTANDSMRDIHDRMPLVLTQATLPLWLDAPESARQVLHDAPPQLTRRAV